MKILIFYVTIFFVLTVGFSTTWFFLSQKIKEDFAYTKYNKKQATKETRQTYQKLKINKDMTVDIMPHQSQNLYSSILNHKPYIKTHLDKLRDKYTKEISTNYINKEACNNIKEQKNFWLNFITSYDKQQLKKFIWCYIFLNPKNQIISQIDTDYEEYRKINIWWWLSTINWKIWKKWEKLSIYENIKEFNWYIKWPYVVWNEIRKIWWWWVCWVSTAAYQVFSKAVDIDIIERHNHSVLDINTFGTVWFDSSIYWDWENPEIDLKAKNNHWKIYIKKISKAEKENDKYKYWVILYSWKTFEKNKITFSDKYTKWNRTCVDKLLNYKNSTNVITSCYLKIKDDYHHEEL